MNYQEELFDDIYPLLEPAWWSNPWMVAGIIVAILSMFVAIFFFIRWYRHKKEIPAWEWAQHEIARLSCDQENFYSDLIIILKKYCSLHYQIAMEPLTDQEFLAYLQKTMHEEWYVLCVPIIEHGTQARFARDIIAPDIRLHDYQAALRFITLTTPQER